jgi:protocatechuate 3,4-dioxygenase alpha subunit
MSTRLPQTPSQTVGPYFAYGLTAKQYGYDFASAYVARLAEPQAEGEHIRVMGRVIDGAGKVVPDAMIEIAQLDAKGREVLSDKHAAELHFKGFGRCGTGTDVHNRFIFDTVKPAADGPKDAPHISVIVTMRGVLVHAFTRIYFDDEAGANANDRVLQGVPEERRATLIARREVLSAGVTYHLDIHMQGAQETVFFDL